MNAHSPTMELQKGPALTAQKAQQKTAPRNDAPDAEEKKSTDHYNRTELFATIKRTRKFHKDKKFPETYDSFWKALNEAFAGFDVKKSKRAPSDLYAMPALFYTAMKNMPVVASQPNLAVFKSFNGSIQVKDGEIQFIPALDQSQSTETKPVYKSLTYDDAFNAVLLAATSGYKVLSINGGTNAQQVMYKRAILGYNASVPENLRLGMDDTFPRDLVPHWPPENQFRDFMHLAIPEPKKPAPSKPKKPATKSHVDNGAGKGITTSFGQIAGKGVQKLKSLWKGAENATTVAPTSQIVPQSDAANKDNEDKKIDASNASPDPAAGTDIITEDVATNLTDKYAKYLAEHWKDSEACGTAFEKVHEYEAYRLNVFENNAVAGTIYFINTAEHPYRIIYIQGNKGENIYTDNNIYMDNDYHHPGHPRNPAFIKTAAVMSGAPMPAAMG